MSNVEPEPPNGNSRFLRLKGKRGTDAAPPVILPVPVWWRSLQGRTAPRSREAAPYDEQNTFASPDRGDQLDVTKPPRRLPSTGKAAFQWPPDCAWLLMDRKSDSNT